MRPRRCGSIFGAVGTGGALALVASLATGCGGGHASKAAAAGAGGSDGAVGGAGIDGGTFDGNLGDGPRPPAPTFTVGAAAQPGSAMLPTSDAKAAPRALAHVVGSTGGGADFVANELIIANDDVAAVSDFAKRWNGTVVKTIDFKAAGLKNVPAISLVHVDASAADVARLGAELQAIDPLSHGDYQVSDDGALHLLAAASHEGAAGARLGLNWVLAPSGIAEGVTAEGPARAADAPSAGVPYTPNAFDWPYMQKGGVQDIGVGAAWRALQATGKLGNHVRVLVMDGGFAPSADFPVTRTVWPPGQWNVPNPSACTGGTACPWHGTWVTTALAGQIDDHFGAAGPGAPVVDLIALQSPSSDLFAYLEYAAAVLVSLAADSPRIINISASAKVPGALGFLVAPLNLVTIGLDAAGISIFACAGNDGADVDHQDSFAGFSWETDVYIPCEMDAVTCVGGLDWAGTTKAGADGMGSNWGSQERLGTVAIDSSVDIYGPYFVWEGPVPGEADMLARLKSGTSFSSPFVAGVAALVLAADPTLSTGGVRDVLFGTAHRSTSILAGDMHGGIWVDAYAAVHRALGDGDLPAFVRVDSPVPGRTISWRWPVTLAATAYDVDAAAMPVISWSSDRDGALGTGTPLNNTTLTPGVHVLTATATSGAQRTTDTVSLTVRNDPPALTITQPAAGASFCPAEAIRFHATVLDANNNAAFPFPTANVVWSSVPAGLVGTGDDLARTLPIGNYTVTARATDEQGASDMKSVALAVRSCVNNPPVVTITNPLDAPGTGPDVDMYPLTSDANGYYYAVTLQASVTDPEDGPLTGASLVWTTSAGAAQPSRSALLGTGATLAVKLYTSCAQPWAGTVDHLITLTATDSGGVMRTATRLLRIKALC
jgi:serine protease